MAALINQVPTGPLVDKDGNATEGLRPWFSNATQILQASTQSGPTANRPTAASTPKRWVGLNYFDTTLGKMIYLKSVSPDVWVDGSGVSV
jgi:hypothetical protein